jgi:hypothetical protein
MLASRLQLLPRSKFSARHRYASATPARRQRDRYVLDRLPGSSSPVSESASISDSHTLDRRDNRFLLGDGRVLLEFWETSVVRRMCARSGDDDLGSTQVRMRNSQVRMSWRAGCDCPAATVALPALAL